MIREDVSRFFRDTRRPRLRPRQITDDEFIDVLLGTRKYTRALYVANKCDAVSLEEVERIAKEDDGNNIMISCESDLGLDELRDRIWQELGLLK